MQSLPLPSQVSPHYVTPHSSPQFFFLSSPSLLVAYRLLPQNGCSIASASQSHRHNPTINRPALWHHPTGYCSGVGGPDFSKMGFDRMHLQVFHWFVLQTMYYSWGLTGAILELSQRRTQSSGIHSYCSVFSTVMDGITVLSVETRIRFSTWQIYIFIVEPK